jgi:succinyl-CoA synthetase beta subunit
MKLHEYQSKKLFGQIGIPIPKSKIIQKTENVRYIFNQFGGVALLKAQVLTGGRGKAGGIRLARSEYEAENIMAFLLNTKIHDHPINKVMIEELIDFDEGYSVGIYFNRRKGLPELRGSPSIKYWQREKFHQAPLLDTFSSEIDPIIGIHTYKIRELAVSMGLDKRFWDEFILIVEKMWDLFRRYDALMVEINPLAVQEEKGLISLGVKIEVDDNSIFRQPEIEEFIDPTAYTAPENDARKLGFSYVKLDGEIGCLVNGAGLAMATIDMIEYFGGRPANFLDIGSEASAYKAAAGLQVLSEDNQIKVIFINIFGGLTLCDQIAEGIITQLKYANISQPLIVRMAGNHSEKGKKLLEKMGVQIADTMREAVQFCIDYIGEINI